MILAEGPLLFSAFGLRLRANRFIPGLLTWEGSSEVDVEIHLGRMPAWWETMPDVQRPVKTWYLSPEKGENGQAALAIWTLRNGSYFRLQYHDGTEFILDRGGTHIWGTWPETLPLEHALIYLRGPVLGFVLRLRGFICLHASAVAVRDQAIALVGPAGAGKSTTAAAFFRLGYPVLSDDVVPLLDRGGSFLAQPAYPRLWLCADIVKVLYGSREALPQVAPTWEKHYVDLNHNQGGFWQRPALLGAIYILDDRSTGPEAPFVESMTARDALLALVSNTYVNFLLNSRMRAMEFELLGRVARQVPVRRVRPRTDPTELTRLCDEILKDFLGLVSPVNKPREVAVTCRP